ncbi:hypothetical protein Ocin01_02048, partial [Orchesella cincta]
KPPAEKTGYCTTSDKRHLFFLDFLDVDGKIRKRTHLTDNQTKATRETLNNSLPGGDSFSSSVTSYKKIVFITAVLRGAVNMADEFDVDAMLEAAYVSKFR